MHMLYVFSSTSADGLTRVPPTTAPGDRTVVIWRHCSSSRANSSLVMPGFHQESLLLADVQAVTTNPNSMRRRRGRSLAILLLRERAGRRRPVSDRIAHRAVQW